LTPMLFLRRTRQEEEGEWHARSVFPFCEGSAGSLHEPSDFSHLLCFCSPFFTNSSKQNLLNTSNHSTRSKWPLFPPNYILMYQLLRVSRAQQITADLPRSQSASSTSINASIRVVQNSARRNLQLMIVGVTILEFENREQYDHRR